MAVFQGSTTVKRVAKICKRVQNHPLVIGKLPKDDADVVLIDHMEQTQLEISEDYLGIQDSVDLDLVVGQSDYPLPTGVFKIRDYTKPETWTGRLNFIFDSNEWSKINDNIADLSDTQPIYAYIWNDVIRFAPTPTVADTIHLDVYLHPSVELTYDGDLEVDPSFDEAIVNELIFKVTGNFDYHNLYLKKASDQAQQKVKSVVGYPIVIQHSSNVLGF